MCFSVPLPVLSRTLAEQADRGRANVGEFDRMTLFAVLYYQGVMNKMVSLLGSHLGRGAGSPRWWLTTHPTHYWWWATRRHPEAGKITITLSSAARNAVSPSMAGASAVGRAGAKSSEQAPLDRSDHMLTGRDGLDFHPLD
jgi:hypothetical protein